MKRFSLFLALILTIGIGATTIQNTIVKPAIPKQIYVKHYYNIEEAKKDISNLYTKGWILKSQSIAFNSASYSIIVFVVMEKY